MKNEKYNENQEFEKLLREKMDQLSDSVDCFDKISARAFPEKSSDFSDSELFVSDLENVTGKRRGAVFLRWTAAAAAIVLCVGVFPKTAIMNNFLANISKNRNELYSSMISEIESETQLNDYRQYDVTLSEYLADDFLITPLYSCPFEDVDREDMRVRIFIRENDGLLTNQVYAVEYSGDYTESNFIAVAESEAKFTDEELANFDSGNAEYTDAVEKLRSSVEKMTKENAYSTLDLKKYTGDGTNSDMAASFSYETLIREGEQIYPIAVYALYHNSHENGGIKYYYDFSCYKYENDEPVPAELSGEAFKWRNAVGFDGCQITPKQSGSRFERKEMLSAVSDISLCAWVVPLENYDGESGAMPLTLAEESTYGFSTLGSVDMPYDNDILIALHVAKKPIRIAYLSQRNTATDFPVIACAVSEYDDTLHVSIGARPVHAGLIELPLSSAKPDGFGKQFPKGFEKDETLVKELAIWCADQFTYGNNRRAGADYRKHVAGVLIRRAICSFGK